MKKLFIIPLMSVILFSLPNAFSGTLMFIGAVTEPACAVDVIARQASVHCLRSGTFQEQHYRFDQYAHEIPYKLGYIKIKSTSNRLDMVITYN
ncbi:hypothetical protein [Pantoea ananatis]|uniref:hypothetical protein n=1 Tax=Pantoea ananas TaxID=553 RepID=UPI002362F742|nr:hypothetical protein [Pantoea ananatis]